MTDRHDENAIMHLVKLKNILNNSKTEKYRHQTYLIFFSIILNHGGESLKNYKHLINFWTNIK